MKELTVRPHDEDNRRLVAFLTGDAWPFHGVKEPTEAQVAKWIAADRYRALHWLESDGEAVGFVNVEEVDDYTPVFDLRVASAWRGRDVGRQALAWLPRFVFEALDKTRVEGHTRADNAAMRHLFESAGWVREAYHRRAWPDEAGGAHDCVTYALLRDDWRDGTTTPVPE